VTSVISPSFISPSQVIKAELIEAIAMEFGSDFSQDHSNQSICDRLSSIQLEIKICYGKYAADYINHYTSSVSLGLAHLLGLDALAIAKRLCQRLEQSLPIPPYVLRVAGKGWIHFELSDRFLADCLASLDHWLPPIPLKSTTDVSSITQNLTSPQPLSCEARGLKFPAPPSPLGRGRLGGRGSSNSRTTEQTLDSYPWELHYAYARCCAMLRLAARERLFDPQTPFRWQLLDSEQNLILQEPAEMQLIMTQLAIADQFTCDRNSLASAQANLKANLKVRSKLCAALAKDFLNFYDTCRIFGLTQDSSRQIAPARIGLISLTQKLITFLAPPNMTNHPAL
jgi:hypothetical protein